MPTSPLTRRLIGSAITDDRSRPAEPAIARVAVGQLEQCLINLAINARDAMSHGGRLQLAVRSADAEPADADDPPGRSTAVAVEPTAELRGDDLLVVVSDTGVGIPAVALTSVFEPFFTTKAVGEGTGLGLAMVRACVETSGGSLTVSSGVGAGTSFAIRLPRSAGGAAKA